jgi:hypothetical protein
MRVASYNSGYRGVEAPPATLITVEQPTMTSSDIPIIISRKQAIEQGLEQYYTGIPCKRGHIAHRVIANWECIVCHRIRNKISSKKPLIRENKNKRSKRYRKIELVIKRVARKKVDKTISNGELIRKPCERCGTMDNVHGHHEDYMKPLEVMWLCPIHHTERHRELRKIAASKQEKSNG